MSDVVIDYSQHEEQTTILAWAGDHHGSFLDLGAHDGASYSNTAALADAGWPGLCIDAAPDVVAACAVRYAARPDIGVLLGAFDHLGGGHSPATVYWKPGTMYSSLDPGRRADEPTAPILVPRIDLAWLAGELAAQPQPLFCSIDLEGGTVDALEWLLANASPQCVCVEANNPADRSRTAGLLYDWKLLGFNDVNLIYARHG